MPQILDRFGRPIRRETLAEPQTERSDARMAALRHEFAGHPSRGLTPSKLARILADAERGSLLDQCDLFEDMEEKDAHIFAELSKRKRAMMGLSWDIEPPPNATAQEERAAELVKELMEDVPDVEDVLFDLADGIGKGYACLEITWQRLGSSWLPSDIAYRPQRWFTVRQEDRNDLRLRDGSPDGAELEPFGWIVHTHRAKSGYLTRAGLHRVLAWPYLFKNYSVRDLAEFLEIYGLPLRLGTYPPGASDAEKSTLLKAVIGIGHDAAGIVPEGMMIDFKEAAKGTDDPFEAMIAWCERSESKAIVGATLTTQVDSTGGNRALGDVHMDVLRDLVVSDARQAQGTLTRDLVYPLAALNAPGIEGPRRAPRLRFHTEEPEDIKLFSDAIPALVDVGMRIPASWAHDRLQIPEPDEDERVLERGGLGGPVPASIARALARSLPPRAIERDAADDFADQLERESGALLDGLVEPVRRLVMTAASLEAVRDGIYELYGGLPSGELAALMAKALAAAELAGRFEVGEGE